MTRTCKCGKVIPEARLKALPFTRTCIACSEVKPVKGHMITPHKTGSHIEIVSESAHEWIQAHDRRKTYGANLPMASKQGT